MSRTGRLMTFLGVALLGAATLAKWQRPGSRIDDQLAKDTTAFRAVLEPHRGRRATSPLQIPLLGWRDIFWRTIREAMDDRIMAVAGGVVYFGLLAVFPAVTALVSLYGLFADRATISGYIADLTMVLPAGLQSIIVAQVDRLVSQGDTTLGLAFAVSLGLALWSANAGTKAIIEALNVAYGESEKRSFIRLNLISLGLTLIGIVALLTALGIVVVVPQMFAAFGIGSFKETIVVMARWPLLALAATAVFAALYRYAPSRRRPKWRWVWIGALAAAAGWIAVSGLLSLYFSKFSDFEASYGALGGLIAAMLWMWVSLIVFLMGAEFNAESERQTLEDTTRGGPRPLGLRGAQAADTVGASP